MPGDGHDIALTIALTEYEFAREQRRMSYEGTAQRFNYYLLIASGGTAVVAGLLGASGGTDTPRVAAAGVVGGIVALLGFVIFIRLVHYRLVSIEQAYTIKALRMYLMSRAPELRRYSMLPMVGDDDAGPFGFPRAQGARTWTGLTQMVGLVNSVLLGLGLGEVVRLAHGAVWSAVACGAVIAIISTSLHRAYERRLVAAADRRTASAVQHRLQEPDPPPLSRPEGAA
jgi:hypothetical protein